MTRRAKFEFAILAVLAAALALLVLNHLEVDEYPSAIGATRGERDLPSWLVTTFEHACPTCGTCAHRFEAAESKITVTITDRDGWYRLFWAADEVYTYDDPAMIGGALRNRTAELTEGTWTIRGTFVATKHDQHECTPAAGDVELRYKLHRGEMPADVAPVIDSSGMVPVPTRAKWFSYPFPPERVDDFWWELENPESFAKVQPCPCGRIKP
jgi:hypothetical protein